MKIVVFLFFTLVFSGFVDKANEVEGKMLDTAMTTMQSMMWMVQFAAQEKSTIADFLVQNYGNLKKRICEPPDPKWSEGFTNVFRKAQTELCVVRVNDIREKLKERGVSDEFIHLWQEFMQEEVMDVTIDEIQKKLQRKSQE